MRRIANIAILCALVVLTAGCGNRNRGTVYNPGNRDKFSSEEEKELAIAQKQAEATGMLPLEQYSNAIKLNIMVPKVSETFPEAAAQALSARMIQITAANGIAGYGGDPSFVFAALVNPVKEGVTNTIPKKNYINYVVSFYVCNTHSGDVFGMLEEEIMGVGASSQEAAINAMGLVSNNEKLASFLKESSAKIVDWFESHTNTYISQVENYLRIGAYDKAYGMLVSVPEEAETCYAFAQKNIDSVHELYLTQLSNSYLRSMQDAIAAADGSYNPQVGAYMSMIPENSQVYSQAIALFENYVARTVENADAERAHQMHMEEEQAEIDRLNAEAELRAQEALMMQMEQEQAQGAGGVEGAADDFIGNVGNGIVSMISEKAQSVIFGGVASILNMI